MSYIGNKPATSFETVQKQVSTTNSGTQITLDRAVTSVQDILVTVDAVIQSYDNYSVSGTTLTLGGTLNNNRVEILYVGRTMQSVDPTDDSVSAAKIKTDAVTTAKVQNDAITVDKLNLISTSSVPSLEAKGDGSSVAGKIKLNCHVNSHGVTLQSPDHSSSQSWTLKLPDNSPTADKFLKVKSITGSGSTATGQLEFADASGGLVYLGGSESSSSASAVTFDNVFSSTYRAYKIIGMIAPSTDTWIKFRLRASSSDLNNNQYINLERTSYIDNGENQAQNNYGNHTATYGAFAQADIDSDSDAHYVGFDFTVYDPNTDVFARHMISGTYTFRNGGSDKLYVGMFGHSATANQNADGIKFETNAGTLSYHSIRVYGMVNS
tara:strand:+ start:271 stop:1410 length:1140 start_codon:yes stop_codon:yes gene_type:complete